MTTFEAILLGLIQGLTEFLPISSSGHLLLAQHLLGYQNTHHYLLFDLVCHLGTLFAIVAYYFRHLLTLAYTDRRLAWQLILGTLPLFAVATVLPYIKQVYAYPILLGVFFTVTACLLFLSHRYAHIDSTVTPQRRWYDPLVVGCIQAVAVLPGISRSGSTIATARLLGWTRQQAVTFSFLLAIPAILGGLSLELLKLFTSTEALPSLIEPSHYILGLVTSFITGCGAIALATRLVLQDRMVYFAWYCLALGLFCFYYFAGM